jgi:hypothetical protein
VELPPLPRLRPGMAGSLRVAAPAAGDSPHVPLSCLRRHFPREGEGEVVVLEGDRPVLRTVRLAEGEGPLVAVQSGLREGDRVVVSDTVGLELAGPVAAREVASR